MLKTITFEFYSSLPKFLSLSILILQVIYGIASGPFTERELSQISTINQRSEDVGGCLITQQPTNLKLY